MRFGCVFLAMVAAGCESTESSGSPETNPTALTNSFTSGPTGGPTGPVVDEGPKWGTQVGSEGYFGCEVLSITSIESNEVLPWDSITVEDEIAPFIGDFFLNEGEPQQPKTLSVVAQSSWIVKAASPCESYVITEVEALFSDVVLRGVVAVAGEEQGLSVVAEASDEGVQAVYGLSPFGERSFVLLDLEMTDEGWSGQALWADCANTNCEQQQVIAQVSPEG